MTRRRRPDAPAHPALAACEDPPAPDRRDDASSRRPARRPTRTSRGSREPSTAAEGRGLRRQRRRQRARRAGRSRARARRSALGGAHPRRGASVRRTVSRSSRSPGTAAALDRRGAGDGDHRHRRRPTRRSTAAIANRIHNVQLVAHLVDDKLIAPGATFSFNGATGERSADEGLPRGAGDHQRRAADRARRRRLPGVDDRLQRRVRGGPADHGRARTTRSTSRTTRSGRDATVNYPDIDLKFVNDTGHWLLLRTFVGSSSLTVALYGTPQHRRVETHDRAAARRRAAAGREDGRRDARAGQRRWSTTTACRRRRPRSSGRSTRRAASSSPTRPGTRATARSRR